MSHPHRKSIDVNAAVITVSSSRTRETDTSGKAIEAILGENNIPVVHYVIVPDDIGSIRQALYNALKTANCIVINGGTGLTYDDCTIEAVQPLLEKEIEGFGEFFRMKSLQQIGTAALLSRATAGLCGGKVVFCIPGSTPAVTLATTEIIVPEVVHILSHAAR